MMIPERAHTHSLTKAGLSLRGAQKMLTQRGEDSLKCIQKTYSLTEWEGGGGGHSVQGRYVGQCLDAKGGLPITDPLLQGQPLQGVLQQGSHSIA